MLTSAEARRLRDEKLDELRSTPFDQLVRAYSAGNSREVAEREGLEVFTTGSFDTDSASDFFVWVFVRPVWTAKIPFIRWFLSARGRHLADNPGS